MFPADDELVIAIAPRTKANGARRGGLGLSGDEEVEGGAERDGGDAEGDGRDREVHLHWRHLVLGARARSRAGVLEIFEALATAPLKGAERSERNDTDGAERERKHVRSAR